MSKAQHNLEVDLALVWERGDEYWATVTVTATDPATAQASSRSACRLTKRGRSSPNI